MVYPDDAEPPGAHEESRSFPARARRPPDELVRGRGEISAGAVEGLNLKAKLSMRKAFGFRTFEGIETALYHQLGHLPEPESTHEFC